MSHQKRLDPYDHVGYLETLRIHMLVANSTRFANQMKHDSEVDAVKVIVMVAVSTAATKASQITSLYFTISSY